MRRNEKAIVSEFQILDDYAADEANEGIPRPIEWLQEIPVPPFLSKTYDLVNDPVLDHIVSWGPNGNSFVIWDSVEFSKSILPRNFKHSNFSSFVRQLNSYGFRKIDANKWEFSNGAFLRGQKHLLKSIQRRKYFTSQAAPPPPLLSNEVETLRRERSDMMNEVMELQQQQNDIMQQVQEVRQRLHVSEQKQKKMVSFMGILLQNPQILSSLRHQNERNRIGSSIVKRFTDQNKLEAAPSNHLLDSMGSGPQDYNSEQNQRFMNNVELVGDYWNAYNHLTTQHGSSSEYHVSFPADLATRDNNVRDEKVSNMVMDLPGYETWNGLLDDDSALLDIHGTPELWNIGSFGESSSSYGPPDRESSQGG